MIPSVVSSAMKQLQAFKRRKYVSKNVTDAFLPSEAFFINAANALCVCLVNRRI